jgi:hypothetical protein
VVVTHAPAPQLEKTHNQLSAEDAQTETARDAIQDQQKKLWQEDNDAKLMIDEEEFRLQNLRKDLASGE